MSHSEYNFCYDKDGRIYWKTMYETRHTKCVRLIVEPLEIKRASCTLTYTRIIV